MTKRRTDPLSRRSPEKGGALFFAVPAGIRRPMTAKSARMPPGDVPDEASGTCRNIIAERVDPIGNTPAHMIPEVTSDLPIPFVIFGCMFRVRRGPALPSPTAVPPGLVFSF